MTSSVPTATIQLSQAELALFQDLVYRLAGIRLADAKHNLVQSRLRRRVEDLGLSSFRDYHRLISDPAQTNELQQCIEALTTNETFFFRHKQHWDFLFDAIIPEWLQQSASGATFRAWCAACSSGEEPYSLAIALTEGLRGHNRNARIEASDINNAVIGRARSGTYGAYALQKVTDACRQRYFVSSADGQQHTVRPDVRAQVEFFQHNLLEAKRGPPCDLILLRNVLIYFDPPSKKKVLDALASRLRPGSWLILGGAETLSDHADSFSYVKPTIYRKR